MAEIENEFLEEIQAAFIQEAADLVASVEGSFLELEKDPSNQTEMAQILRLFHNLKGSAAAVNFSHLSELCHKVENLLAKVKEKEIELTPEIVELLLECTDRVNIALATLSKNRLAELDFLKPIHKIEQLLSRRGDAPTPPPKIAGVDPVLLIQKLPEALVLADENNVEAVQNLRSQLLQIRDNLPPSSPLQNRLNTAIAHLEKVLAQEDGKGNFAKATDQIIQIFEAGPQKSDPQKVDREIDPKLLEDFVSDAKEQLDSIDSGLILLEKEPLNSSAVDAIFRGFHTLKSASAIVQAGEIEKLAHDIESLLQPIRDKNAPVPSEVGSICLDGTALIRQLVELHIQGHSVPAPSLSASLHGLKQKLSSLGVLEGGASQAKVTNDQTVGLSTATVREPIKVDADRLDRLVDSIGELVIAETMVAQSQDLKAVHAASILFKHLDRLGKITRTLQEIGLALRMVPIRQTFKKMTRIVRDLSKKLGKEIDFQVSGEDTELDRTVAEKIGDPLVHMIRNAIDHGIEKTKDIREAAGKPATGRVELRACHKGGSIWIEIEDDGRGLDKEVLIKKAIQKGIIQPNQQLTDQEAYRLIFAPGFSTAEVVTDVSGRGVGMDVARKNIEELRGQIDIETEKGKGTVFRIRIPNTLAIIEGMVIRVSNERYVIPTQSILMAIKPEPKHIIKASSTKQEMLELHGEILPFFRLSELYNIKGAITNPAEGIVLIVEDNRKRLGLLVDHIINQQQFVIKSLGDLVKNVPGVSGGTIMPDGQVGLILDVGLLVQGLLKNRDKAKAEDADAQRKEQ